MQAESPRPGRRAECWRELAARTTRSHTQARGHAMHTRDAHCPRSAAPTREPLSGRVSQLALALARRLDQGCALGAYTVPADEQCARPSSLASTRGLRRPRRFRGSAPGAAAVGSGRQQAEQSAAPRRPSMRRRSAGGPSGVTSCNHQWNERAAALGWH